MEHNQIDLKNIQVLKGMNFFIPDYQRGYRWTKQQVNDLLDDIWEFMNNGSGGWYSLQPVVVKKREPKEGIQPLRKQLEDILKADSDTEAIKKTSELLNRFNGWKNWEVVDGQQRLTSLFIVLKFLDQSSYSIEYETRAGSYDFLEKLTVEEVEDMKSDADTNIDYYHMFQTYNAVNEWFIKIQKELSGELKKKYNENLKGEFKKTILEKVKVIWCEITENPIDVFTRINSGKIPLTNAELIKALFLNSSNFKDANSKISQLEIAIEWDQIEYALQDDEFWLFFSDYSELESPTRIDFLFDLVCEKDLLKLNDDKLSEVGNDKDKAFRYFNYYLESGDNKIYKAWAEVKTLFSILKEWYNDLELFHYVGFLIEVRDKNKHSVKTIISAMVEEWRKEKTTKEDFIKTYIIPQIQTKIKKGGNANDTIDLSLLEYGDSQVRSVLLLHNIQTIINQNDLLEDDDKYKMPVFYKFPFHLYKKESWNVEHIDSATENNLTNVKDQKEWLFFSKDYVLKNQKIKIEKDDNPNEKMSVKLIDQIDEFIKCAEPKNFEDLATNIMQDEGNRLGENEKDKLWNLCLLDEKTNKGYGNDIFPVKRRKIIAKSQGKILKVNLKYQKIFGDKGDSAFVPICTERVFQKAYNPIPNNLREWDKGDAEAYKNHITETLGVFINKEER